MLELAAARGIDVEHTHCSGVLVHLARFEAALHARLRVLQEFRQRCLRMVAREAYDALHYARERVLLICRARAAGRAGRCKAFTSKKYAFIAPDPPIE